MSKFSGLDYLLGVIDQKTFQQFTLPVRTTSYSILVVDMSTHKHLEVEDAAPVMILEENMQCPIGRVHLGTGTSSLKQLKAIGC